MISRSEFRAGDVLTVDPKDGDDCEAVARTGQQCTFVRYATMGKYAVVRFTPTGKNVYFRETDLRVKDA